MQPRPAGFRSVVVSPRGTRLVIAQFLALPSGPLVQRRFKAGDAQHSYKGEHRTP